MTRLFTKTDIERAARLAATHAMARPNDTLEHCVAETVDIMTNESPHFYSESEVTLMLQYVLGKDDVSKEVANALDALRR